MSDYEDLTACALDDDMEQQLLDAARECVFQWTNKAGEPFGVIMSFLEVDGTIWLTAAETRARISAIRRDPRVAITVTSVGTGLRGGMTASYKGIATVHRSREIKDWFYPTFCGKIRADDPAARDAFQKHLDSPDRVVIEVRTHYKLTFDSAKMWTRSPDAVPESRRAELGLA